MSRRYVFPEEGQLMLYQIASMDGDCIGNVGVATHARWPTADLSDVLSLHSGGKWEPVSDHVGYTFLQRLPADVRTRSLAGRTVLIGTGEISHFLKDNGYDQEAVDELFRRYGKVPEEE